MFNEKTRTILLGMAFLLFLGVSYFENKIFFDVLNVLFQKPFLAVFMIFIHNIIVISLILLGMSFYANLVVLNFFKKGRYSHSVLEHPRIFAIIFTLIILVLSILRGISLFFGVISFEVLPQVLFVSASLAIIEGYGIFLTIKKTLSRSLSMKGLIHIYGVFLIAAVIEVVFINFLATA